MAYYLKPLDLIVAIPNIKMSSKLTKHTNLPKLFQDENNSTKLISPEVEQSVNTVTDLAETKAKRVAYDYVKSFPQALRELRNMYASPFMNYLRNFLHMYEAAAPVGKYIVRY